MVERGGKSYVAEVDITVCMHESLKFQGKFNANRSGNRLDFKNDMHDFQ